MASTSSEPAPVVVPAGRSVEGVSGDDPAMRA
jgi:hypothetical protein